jgi:biotin carboxyl carrier protein
VNGTTYNVEIEREKKSLKTPVLVRPEPAIPRSAHKFKKNISSNYLVKAPLPGNIMQLYVKEGDEVSKGDNLIMYEAMKMENLITAEKGGKVDKIKVSGGESVLQGDILMEIV